MAGVFPQALGPQQPSAYELLLAELQKQQPAPRPAFTPEQQRQRVESNNSQIGLGLLGQLSGDRQMSPVGAGVFKQALGAREERTTNRGIQDPLTGETAIDPEYAAQQHEARRGKVLEQALRFEDQRERARERSDQDRQRAEDRQGLAQTVAALRQGQSGTDTEMKQLRKDLVQAQIDRTRGLTETAADKATIAAAKVKSLAGSVKEKSKFMVSQLDMADKLVGISTTGPGGYLARRVPGTDAYNLAKLIDTVKANIGFAELGQMRQESPTGGALGQVAIKELEMLQATLGNLDTAQSPSEVRRVIKQVKTHFERLGMVMDGANVEVPPQAPPISAPPGTAPPTPTQPAPGAAPPQAPRRRYRIGPDGTLVPVS